MNSKFLTLVVLAAVVAVGTYLGLNYVVPYQKEEAKAAQTVPVESVFSGGLQAPAAGEPAEAAPAAAEPATAPAPAAEGNVPTESATVSPQAEQPAAEPQAASKPAAAPAQAKPENVASAEPAAPPKAEPAPMAKPAAKPAPAPAAKAEPEKKAEAKPAPAAEPKAEPKAAPKAEPKPAPAAKPAATKPAAAAPAPALAKAAAAPAATAPWWGSSDASHLSLVYVGSAAFQKAIVLMFNGEFSTSDSANTNLQVADAKGAKVAGSWKIGPSNKRMLVFPVNSAGKYTVSVKTGLADSSGRTVAQEAHGPVSVQ